MRKSRKIPKNDWPNNNIIKFLKEKRVNAKKCADYFLKAESIASHVEQYFLPQKLDFKNLRTCIDKYCAERLFIRLKGSSCTGQSSTAMTSLG